ncbi:hypothetical protein SDRG_00089 [Saprolegnia diclina VS20]|uniref:Uncharacterized protein n=1 Tax=Saprolegnia diclina (strain VS20) TaxID=1156394 RepID=T0R5Y2_SAPDV|nr:hypothetical protein SDRG_00089 [Saprolegnia diclina VS20]EQC42351.1 hypothetical protein SDRG_00089 [Saprolegnia diclina VS20]|eukprot:XP_008603774.1 hypothetical protein SDRG_00089 [Saprolegnia diclina VS20]
MDIALLLTSDDGSSDHSGIVQSPRAGIWTLEEERYSLALIECFAQGYLPDIMLGTSLRCFLADKLYCSPMRVSKKLATGRLAGVALPAKLGPIRYENQQVDPVQQVVKLEQLADAERAYAERLDAYDIKFTDPTAVMEMQTKTQAPYLTRVGLWSRTEQLYAWKLIECFIKGYITLPVGTRLRSFLAERLRCSPMRISKKLATGSIAGIHLPKKLGTMAYAPPKVLHDGSDMDGKVAALAELHRLRQACFGYN